MEIAAGKILPDELQWSKSGKPLGPRTARAFSTAAMKSRKRGPSFSRSISTAKSSIIGSAIRSRRSTLTYYRPEHPQWEYEAVVTEDGHWLVVVTHLGTDSVEPGHDHRPNEGRGEADRNDTLGWQLHCHPLLARRGRRSATATPTVESEAKPIELIDNFQHEYTFVGNVGTEFYFKTDLDAPRRRLAAIDIDKLEGPRAWKEIIPQAEPTLMHVGFVGDRFIASYLEDVKPKTRVFKRNGRHIRDVQFPAIGTAGGFGGERTDKETFYTFSSFATPSSIYRYDIASGESSLFRRPELKFNPDDYVVKQVFYRSKDSGRVPMFIVHKKGIELDGSNPTLLYGYGGFDISVLPGLLGRTIGVDGDGRRLRPAQSSRRR